MTFALVMFPPLPDPTIMPVLAIVTTFAVPLTPTVTLEFAVAMVTLLVPLVIELPLGNPVNALPLPTKKLALMLPDESLSAIVDAVLAVAVVAPFNKLALRFATTVVEATTNGAPLVAVEIS